MPAPPTTPHVAPADIDDAYERLRPVVRRTPLEKNDRLADLCGARAVYLKREDLQTGVRSYKIRGAYNRMSRLTDAERARGVVCASAGNHAQGVALSCHLLETPGTVFMPRNTPRQKVARVGSLGGDWVRIELVGDTFDEAKHLAADFAAREGRALVHPFDDPATIAGQGTVGRELFEDLPEPADVVLVPVGGGGLLAGMLAYARVASPETRFVGVEPAGAPSLQESLAAGRVVTLERIDTFVDGAAVQAVGRHNFDICAALYPHVLTDVVTVPEGQVCATMIDLYQNEGIVAEPAGALTVSVLTYLRDNVKEKAVVCVVSGGNNDISRYPEVIERSLVHRGLKHYFLIEFSQRAGALRQYLDEALGPTDDITLFEYVKKNNREFGPALVGVELAARENLGPLMARMDAIGLRYQRVEQDSPLYRFLV